MSSMIQCDKCGAINSDPKKFKYINGHRMVSATSYSSKADDAMDLCLECYNKIFNKEDKNNGN